jgi:hypothetical protein
MQGLYAPVKDLWIASYLGDQGHFYTGFLQGLCSASARHYFDVELVEAFAEIDEPGFVMDAYESPLYRQAKSPTGNGIGSYQYCVCRRAPFHV